MRAHHYRIVDPKTREPFRRMFFTFNEARHIAGLSGAREVAEMNQFGKVLRYLPVNPKAKP